jgi:hypothetical protein
MEKRLLLPSPLLKLVFAMRKAPSAYSYWMNMTCCVVKEEQELIQRNNPQGRYICHRFEDETLILGNSRAQSQGIMLEHADERGALKRLIPSLWPLRTWHRIAVSSIPPHMLSHFLCQRSGLLCPHGQLSYKIAWPFFPFALSCFNCLSRFWISLS